MLNLSAIDPLTLQSVLLEQGSQLPRTLVLYIGKSVNLAGCWRQYNRYKELEVREGVKIAYLNINSSNLLPELKRI